MSLILQDPEKYFELLAKIAEEEKNQQIESLKIVREASDEDILAGLKWIGVILHQIRMSKGLSLKEFVSANFEWDSTSASRISNIERGLDIPDSNIIKRYVDLLKDPSNDLK